MIEARREGRHGNAADGGKIHGDDALPIRIERACGLHRHVAHCLEDAGEHAEMGLAARIAPLRRIVPAVGASDAGRQDLEAVEGGLRQLAEYRLAVALPRDRFAKRRASAAGHLEIPRPEVPERNETWCGGHVYLLRANMTVCRPRTHHGQVVVKAGPSRAETAPNSCDHGGHRPSKMLTPSICTTSAPFC